ncbi:MAG: dienelactone hydrolase family protein [Myxococcota bacterium]|nr:dienelactone hydrolase family protein [Myxococcota bacterium]
MLVGGAVAAGYALAAGPVSAEAIQTDAEGLEAGMVEVPAADRTIRAYRARPTGPSPLSVVLVVHEIFGLHEYIRDVCRRLAKQGYLAVAPDLYQRQGDPSGLASIDAVIREVVAKVPDAQVMKDLDATLAWARQNGGHAKLAAVTGFCWGGRIVWLYAAHRPELTAGVAWYGRLTGDPRELTPRHPIDLVGERMAPVLGLYGGADRGIPLETVFEMRRKLAERTDEARFRSEIMIFPNAPHGFHADYRPSYRSLAAAEAWRRMLEWFERHHLLEVEARDAPEATG